MRLLLLITDLQRGGTPTVVRELAGRLRDGEIEIEVACLAPRGPVAQEIERQGTRVTALEARSIAAFRPARRRLIHLIQNGQFDVVFSFLVHANVLAASAIRHCPSVRLIQSIQTTQPRPRWHWIAQRWAAKSAGKIIVPSQSIADAARKCSAIPPEKIVIIPNAVDPSDFESIRGDPARPVQTMGYLGRFDPIKRIPDLIRAVSYLDSSLKLSIFGDGPDRPRIVNTIERFNMTGRVTLHGMVNTPQEAMSQIDLLALPSRAEGMPMVLIEAMAAQIPIVATDAPGIRDIISHEQTGLLTPVADSRALADAISRLMNDSALRQHISANALTRVKQRYSWSAVLPQYRSHLIACPEL
jgi:glycosyltransferase involved in cell wall biosynthesis